MDGQRFDAITKRLAARLSRRSAIGRGGAGLATLAVGAAGLAAGTRAAPRRQATGGRYVVIRTYLPSGSVGPLQQTLDQGYAPLLSQQPGFVEYAVVQNGPELVSITVFEDEDSEQTATSQVADWVEQNLAPLLPAPTETIAGQTIVETANAAAFCPGAPTAVPAQPTAVPIQPTQPTAVPAVPTAVPPTPAPTQLPICTDPNEPGRGCPCETGVENPCGDDTLVCCPNDPNQAPGGPGVCTPDRLGCDPTGPTPTPTELPICTDPSRPGVGCTCATGTQNPCGDTTLVCCQNDPNQPPGAPGTCTPASVGCDPTGPTPTPSQLPVCTDPDRPGVGCDCTTGTENPCGDSTLLCCENDPNQPPGGPGICTPSSVGCDPTGPTPTPSPPPTPPPCTGRGCRCNGGVQDNCDDGLTCCPDNPGLPGGPGRCVRQDNCNPPDCTSEGCTCHSGVDGACDSGLVCCADDSSQAGGPGRCEAEDVCYGNQCQATGNPCPTACSPGTNCNTCCSGYCGGDDTCATPPCGEQGCECSTGTQNPCDDGLICCSNDSGLMGGPGTCTAAESCSDDVLPQTEATPVA